MSNHQKAKPFLFHGLVLHNDNENAKADCPFCGRDKFFLKQTSGEFVCKLCGEGGNIYNFLQSLWKKSVENTTDKQLEPLAKEWQTTVAILKELGLAKSLISGEWICPGFNEHKKLANLYRYVMIGGKKRFLGTTDCKAHPLGVLTLNKRQKTLAVVEGIKDASALIAALRSIKATPKGFIKTTNEKESLGETVGVLPVPGAGSFSKEWLKHFAHRSVIIPFDNDYPKTICSDCKKSRPHPELGKKNCPHCKSVKVLNQRLLGGLDGANRIVKLLNESTIVCEGVRVVYWGEKGYDTNRPDGFDIRDLLKIETPAKAWGTLNKLAIEQTIESNPEVTEAKKQEIEILPRDTFEALWKDYQNALHTTPLLKQTLAATLALVISTTVPGVNIWMRIIGPPGSGKTTIADAISASRFVFAKSVLTGFHSGFTGGAGGAKKDSSLIPLINGKTFAIKDGDTLLSAPNYRQILSELRDIFDGSSSSIYRNRVSRDYHNIQTTFLICGTDELRGMNNAALGDRFLDCEILGKEDRNPYLDRAIEATRNKVQSFFARNLSPEKNVEEFGEATADKMPLLQGATVGYLEQVAIWLQDGKHVIQTGKEEEDQIKALGTILSYMRARPKKEKGELLYRPRPELATRLCSQFEKFSLCLALVLNKSKVDAEVINILQKITKDTGEGFQSEIMEMVSNKPLGLTAIQFQNQLRLSEGHTRRTLDDMIDLGILKKVQRPNNSGVRGRHTHYLTLSKELRELWKIAFKGYKA